MIPDPPGRPGGAIRANVAWSILGVAISSLAQWLVLAVLARHGGPATVGHYALGLAISAPVILLGSMALRTVQVTDTRSGFSFQQYLTLRIACMSAAAVLIAVLAITLHPGSAVAIALVGCAKAVDGVADIYFGSFQRHEQMKHVGISLIVNGLLTVLAVVAALRITGSLTWAMVGSVGASAFGGLLYCVVAARPIRDRERGAGRNGRPDAGVAHSLGGMVRTAIPIGLSSALGSVTINVPRYQIEHWLGTAALGTFAALAYVVLAANMVFSPVAQAVLPRLARLYQSERISAFTSLTLRLVGGASAVGAAGIVAAWLFGGELLGLLYGPAYRRYATELVVLTVAAAIGGAGSFLVGALSATRRFRYHFAASVAGLALAAASGATLIPRYGLIGAAWAVVVTTGVDALVKTALLHHVLTRREA